MLISSFVAAFFIYVIFRPSRLVLRFIFYKIVVRAYGLYISILHKLGWKPKSNIFAYVFQQKLIHVLVIFITVILVFTNLTQDTKAGSMMERAHKTILFDLIQSEFGEFEEDEQLVIETFDKEATITAIQQTYLDNLSSVRAQPKVSMDAQLEEEYEEELVPTIQDGTAIVKPDIATTRIAKKPRKETIEYTVKGGDSVSTIAAEFEISVSTILWENNLSAYSIIRPGDVLDILPQSGITHKVASGENISSLAKKYDVEEDSIITANKLAVDAPLTIGEKLFIPGGQKVSYSTYAPTIYTGISVIRDIVKSPDASPAPANKMNWPTVGSQITQYYSWRHHGLDIANKIGTPIYAADAGTIESIGWGTGYGNQIVIDHGGGKKTRYAHLSKFFVEKGQTVDKGETIAAMGSTGWSTGPHLHFEVIINGQKYNPLNYIQ